jgi:lysophospholipase L1-like esterase
MRSNSTEPRLSPRGKRLAVAALTIIALCAMLVAAEIAVRVRQQMKYGSATVLEDYWRYDPRINLRVPVANFASGSISINSLGFRGPEIPVAKPAGTVRLAFLGASTTWCGEVSGNEVAWPHLVSESLRKTFSPVRFDYVNAGVPGYTMRSLLKSMELRVAPLQPDIVVIYEAANDLSGDLRAHAAAQGLVKTAEFEPFSWPSRYSLLWSLVEKNLRVLSSEQAARSSVGRLAVDPGTLGEGYRQALTQVVRAAQRHAKIVAVVTFSIHPRRNQTPEEQIRGSISQFVYMPFVTPQLVMQSYERYNAIAREVARETGALLIEREDAIPGDPSHFADTVHFTDLGSRAMAKRVAEALASSDALHALLEPGAGGRPAHGVPAGNFQQRAMQAARVN